MVLASGSAGNCTLVEGSRGRALIDCGLSARAAAAKLWQVGCEPRSIDAVVVTHEHSDHVAGAPLFSRRFGVPIFTTEATASAAGLRATEVAGIVTVETGRPFAVGDLNMRPFSVPHDAADNVGLVVECGGTRLGYATDLGHLTSLVTERLRECDVLVTEANHDAGMLRDGPYPWGVKQRILGRHGHLSNEEMVDLISRVTAARTRRITLAHLSETNNRPDLALAACRRALESLGRTEVRIEVARQREVSGVMEA